MNSPLLRTQIYLPQDLRKEIDHQRSLTGESLADFIRKAAEERIKKRKKKEQDLAKLAEEIFSDFPTRTEEEAEEWIRWIRQEREASEERFKKQWKGVK